MRQISTRYFFLLTNFFDKSICSKMNIENELYNFNKIIESFISVINFKTFRTAVI